MAEDSGKILVRNEGRVRIVTINRPQVRNALDNEAALMLGAALREFETDAEASVAVLTGAGGAFCSGADLKALGAGVDYFPWAGSENGPLRGPLAKPVIAAIAGTACAGGLGVALFCDIRIAEENATFGVFSRRWGVPMSDGTTVRLPRLIGQARALDMLITGRAVGAGEALEWGLATRLVPNGGAPAAGGGVGRQNAGFSPIALPSDRRSAYEQADYGLAAAIAREAELATEARRKEAMAGAKRFADGKGRHGSFQDL
mgnify:CR=1 FL=1